LSVGLPKKGCVVYVRPGLCFTRVTEYTQNILMQHEAIKAYKTTVVSGSEHRLPKLWNETVYQQQRYSTVYKQK